MLKTSLKSLALVAALFGSGELMAQACNTNAWGAGNPTGGPTSGTPEAGSPLSGTPIARYSGRCGLFSNAAADYVRDGSPNDEPTYIARFYVRPAITGGTAVIFRALDDAFPATPALSVSYTGTQLTFAARGATSSSVNVTANAWYSVEVNWTAGGSMTYIVQGAGSATPSTGTLTGVTAGTQVDQADLGWISGGTGGSIHTDAFESRRTQPIGRLLKGDSNNSGGVSIADAVQVVTEVNGGALAGATGGQAECNEVGSVSIGDAVCIVTIVNN